MEELEIFETEEFQHWFEELRDQACRFRILARLRRLSLGHVGRVKAVGHGVLELRVDCGPGYRVYFAHVGPSRIVLLAGGDKSSQKRDIERAKALAKGL